MENGAGPFFAGTLERPPSGPGMGGPCQVFAVYLRKWLLVKMDAPRPGLLRRLNHPGMRRSELHDSKVVNLYDAANLRKERVYDDGEKVKSFFSGLPTVNESSASDTFSYLMGHQLMGFEKNGSFNYFVTDGLSSVRLVPNSSGTEIASYEHDEFGNLLAKTGSGSSLKTYVGGLGVHDDTADTNLLYMRARHYDPTTTDRRS